MKVLIIGAGVIGSFNAARLKDGGADVTLLARGRRLAELREHGVVLEGAFDGRRSVTQVPLVEHLEPEDQYDMAIVIVRRSQITSVLPMLARNRMIPTVLFLGNNTAGQSDMIAALGKERVLIGMINAGGERLGHVVRYIYSRRLPIQLSELDGARTPRAEAIVRLFNEAGLNARLAKDIDALQKTHAAGLPAFAGALYMCGGDVRRLAHTPSALRLFVRSYREALRAMRKAGVPILPRATRLIEWIPQPVTVLACRLFFNTNLAVVGGQRHANAAVDEMKELTDELRAILGQAGLPCPASDVLFAEVDAQYRHGLQPGPQSTPLAPPALATTPDIGVQGPTWLLVRVSWVALALAAAQVVVGVGMSILPNPEGWVGGILYAGLYALPLFMLGLALRSSRRLWRTVAGWLALVLSLYYSMVVIGNWAGYSPQQAILVVTITVPTVAVDLAIFWAAVLHRRGRRVPSTPAPG